MKGQSFPLLCRTPESSLPQPEPNAARTDVEAESLDDLMDPAQAPDASGEDADDLLASMADEAIDRMLAGDTDAVPPSQADAHEEVHEEVHEEAGEGISEETRADDLPDLSEDEAAALAKEEEAGSSAVSASDDDELDALLRGDPEAAPPPNEEPEPAQDASAAVAAELEADLAQSPPPSKEADLDALMAGEEANQAEPDEADAPAVDVKPTPAGTAATPLYLRPLVWMNRPLHGSPSARDVVGKIALLTLLNATGLFVYVLLRR